MNTSIRNLTLLSLIVLTSTIVCAQNNNAVTMPIQLNLPPSASFSLAGEDVRFSLDPNRGTEQIITPSTVGKIWLNYSSIVAWNSTNAICASLSSGNLPPEVVIKLLVGPDVSAGSGKVGKPLGKITLTSYPQTIISGIGSCYTGQGINKGHPLTFSWEMLPEYESDILSLEDLNIQVGVIYTIISEE